MSVVEPSQPDEDQGRWMLLFEMLTIDSLAIAAPGAAWLRNQSGDLWAKTGYESEGNGRYSVYSTCYLLRRTA